MIETEATAIEGVLVIAPRRFEDARGCFCETYNRDALARAGIETRFVQDNQSLSRRAGTIRGLHYQSPPQAQAKLVRVLSGRVLDVVVDLRPGSPSFGHHVTVTLSAQSGRQLFVPEGFAHGFCTLEPDTQVFYKVSAPYSPAHDRGLAFDDPDLGIDWPVPVARAVLSDRDRRHPRLRDLAEAVS